MVVIIALVAKFLISNANELHTNKDVVMMIER